MLPGDLNPTDFASYPPQAKRLAVAHLTVLRQLPLCFVPSLLRQWIDYDSMFPVEAAAFKSELAILSGLNPDQLKEWFQVFARVRLTSSQEKLNWVSQPAQFVEQLSAYLWSTHQMDLFRSAATGYADRIHGATRVEPLSTKRLGVAVIGQGVTTTDKALFRKLRAQGTLFDKLNADRGLEHLLAAVASRAKLHPAPYAHWYVDGGTAAPHSSQLTCVAYDELGSAREMLLKDISQQVQQPGMGPEELHSHLARISPSTLGLDDTSLLDRFKVKLLTEGSGTQVFSTTFAQWTTREILRRAEPLTLLVRYAPRQRERPMSDLLSSTLGAPEVDPLGSLVDADMGAYYQWINQQRLPESGRSSFLAWFEGHREAIAIGPSMARGVRSSSTMDLAQLSALVCDKTALS